MARPSNIRLGLTECRGSLQRVGPARQRPGTFRRLADGTEKWWTHCDRCDTFQVVLNHRMVRHSSEGEPYDAAEHVQTRTVPEGWIQPELDFTIPAEDDEEEPSF